jgi:aspartate aminotransferase
LEVPLQQLEVDRFVTSQASHTTLPAFSTRLGRIGPSATAEMFRRVAELKAQGAPIISLSVGEPDFAPPREILEAAERALQTGPYGYTQIAGLPQLRAAICARSQARRGLAHTVDSVVVTAGAKHALFHLAQALFDHGDEVVIPTPSWVSYADQARLAGATPVFVPCDEAHGFLPTAAALEAAITPKTKAVILCSPNNPTGASFDKAALRSIADVLKARACWVIVDEIYAELYYDGAEAPSLLSVAPELRDRTVIVDGVSKTYAMTGFRVGWLIAPRELARACETLQSQSTSSITTVAQLSALAAVSGDQSCVQSMRAAYRERRDVLVSALSALPGLTCQTPTGAFYVFANVQGWLGRKAGARLLKTDVDVAEWLLEEAQVACMPGSAFGGPGYLRISYAAGLPELRQAVARISTALASLKGL